MAAIDPPAERMTFAQREGSEDVPPQLKPRELGKAARALLWRVVYDEITNSVSAAKRDKDYSGRMHWRLRRILGDLWVEVYHQSADEFTASGEWWTAFLKQHSAVLRPAVGHCRPKIRDFRKLNGVWADVSKRSQCGRHVLRLSFPEHDYLF